MSTNRVGPPEQQPIYQQQYPQYPYPPPYFSPFPPPKKDKTAAIVAVVVILAIGIGVAPMFMSYFFFMPYDDVMIDDYDVQMAFDSSVEVEGPTKAKVQLDHFSRDPAATEFEVIVIRDGTSQGTYLFTNDHDCDLYLRNGQNVGSLSYRDMNNNFELDPGDEISMTDLTPDSFYEVRIIYLPTGYDSSYASFRTPET